MDRRKTGKQVEAGLREIMLSGFFTESERIYSRAWFLVQQARPAKTWSLLIEVTSLEVFISRDRMFWIMYAR